MIKFLFIKREGAALRALAEWAPPLSISSRKWYNPREGGVCDFRLRALFREAAGKDMCAKKPPHGEPPEGLRGGGAEYLAFVGDVSRVIFDSFVISAVLFRDSAFYKR